MTPAEMELRRRRTRRIWTVVIGIVLVVGVFGYVGWYNLFREVPQSFSTVEDEFKYGSIGVEQEEGMPYWIWAVLPRMFPEKLPDPDSSDHRGGYTSLGIVWEEGQEMPVGFSKKTVGVDRVAINCAFCHTATFRVSPKDNPTIVPAGPSHQVNPQGYIRFLQNCVSDPRFNPDAVLKAIDAVYDLPVMERLFYRYLYIPETKRRLLEQKELFAWMNTRPDWGKGRIDPFNPVKFRVLKQPVDETIGNSDMVPLWNQRPRKSLSLHWDGLNNSLVEVFNSSAIGDGATRKSINLEGLKKMEEWLMDLPPPRYPFPIDQQLAARGSEIFVRDCASCHAFGGQRTGAVIPLSEIGTDRHRLDMWTDGSVQAYNDYARGYSIDFNSFRKTDGYVAVPLDGLWLRAPYLHNGSVPSLTDLLEPAEKRPTQFYRGYDVYDQEKVGFVSAGPDAEKKGFRYETDRPGNANIGHSYGTALPADEKRALIEYLKSL
jgi:hypothetical protein